MTVFSAWSIASGSKRQMWTLGASHHSLEFNYTVAGVQVRTRFAVRFRTHIRALHDVKQVRMNTCVLECASILFLDGLGMSFLRRHWRRFVVLKLFARGAVILGPGQSTGSVTHHVTDLLLFGG